MMIAFRTLMAAAALSIAAPAQSLLTLDSALALAFEANPAYRIAKADEQAAKNNATWGKAGLLPKVDATAAWTRSILDSRQERVQGTGVTVESRDGAESEATTAGIGATWTVFEGFSSLAAFSRLEAQARIAALRSGAARQELAAGVVLAYVDVVRQKRLLLALDSVMAFSRERVRITEGKYKLGSVSKLELLQSKLDMNADSSARLRQELALASSKRALNLLLLRPDSHGFEVEDSLALPPLPPLSDLKAWALESNPTVLQAGESRRVASLAYREYVGRLLPSLGISAGYNYNLTDSEAGFLRSNEQQGFTYGANLRWNLFDGGAVRSDLRNAQLARSKADLQFDEARSRAESGLVGAWDAYQAALQVLGLEGDNLELARENAAIARERLRLGTIVPLEVRAAQEKYLEAETRLVSAQFEAKRGETELLRLAARLAR
jgi:outer membrane protein